MGQEVLLAVDDTDASQKMLHWFMQHELQADTKVHLLHIALGDAVNGRHHMFDLKADYFDQAHPQEQHKVEMEMLNKRFLTTLSNAGVKTAVHIVHASLDSKTIGSMVCGKAEELRVNRCYLAHITHERSLLGQVLHSQTVTEYCRHHCKVPLTLVTVTDVDGASAQPHTPVDRNTTFTV